MGHSQMALAHSPRKLQLPSRPGNVSSSDTASWGENRLSVSTPRLGGRAQMSPRPQEWSGGSPRSCLGPGRALQPLPVTLIPPVYIWTSIPSLAQ